MLKLIKCEFLKLKRKKFIPLIILAAFLFPIPLTYLMTTPSMMERYTDRADAFDGLFNMVLGYGIQFLLPCIIGVIAATEERQRRMERIKRRKAQGLQDRYLYDYTFANNNGQNPLMDKARAYVENWKEAYKNNTGLLLFGDVGTGKSFFAGCIANALLDRDVPVLMTNFPTILNRLTGMFSEDKADFIASFDEYDLLIIDDLGVERSTEYAMEQMFFVIDSRYRSRRPMIITTNLKLSELKNPPDLAHARIYDRILERCAPILFDGKNFREENAGATRQTAKDIVNSKQD